MRALALWLLGGAAAAPLSRQRTSLERAGDRDAQLGASAPSSDGGICDPSWCSCNRCEAQALDPGSCNLCEQRWVFVLSAGGAGTLAMHARYCCAWDSRAGFQSFN